LIWGCALRKENINYIAIGTLFVREKTVPELFNNQLAINNMQLAIIPQEKIHPFAHCS
jgi:hypothetical protein